ncbi:MAG: hypothetical protein JSR76_05660 [Verrucomicrobia bacterium]|nr:hypothetical protein [Verrucomicrobiota bacterium]
MDLTPTSSFSWTNPFNMSSTMGCAIMVGGALLMAISYLVTRLVSSRPQTATKPMESRQVTFSPSPSPSTPISSALTTSIDPIGLRNEGNTCFIASALHAISGTTLEEAIFASSSRNEGLDAVRAILLSQRDGHQAPVGALTRARSIALSFAGSGECSSAEFLGTLADLVDVGLLARDSRAPMLREVSGRASKDLMRTFTIGLSVDTTSPPTDLETLIARWQRSPGSGAAYQLNMNPDTLFFEVRPSVVPEAGDGVLSHSDVNPTMPDIRVPMDFRSSLCPTAPKDYRLKSFIRYLGTGSEGHYVAYMRTTDREGHDSYFVANDSTLTLLIDDAESGLGSAEEQFRRAASQAVMLTYQFNPLAGLRPITAPRAAAARVQPVMRRDVPATPHISGDEAVAREIQANLDREAEAARVAQIEANEAFARAVERADREAEVLRLAEREADAALARSLA